MKEFGLNGLECFHSDFNADMQLQLVELANQYHLMITGGSDFHGTNKPDIELGFGKNNLKIDYEVLEKIKNSFYYIDYESSVVPRGPEITTSPLYGRP